MGEFELIKQYFKRPAVHAVVGVGDDCALLQPAPGTQLAISSDMLVEGRHFFADVDPESLGHKALAVNLSDLAACGARPLAFTLALSLPRADEAWLAAFSKGLFALADRHGCELVGGDTTRGPLNICITVFGEVPVEAGQSQALLRSGAKPGDDLYVSGNLGDARLALEALRGTVQISAQVLAAARLRLERPSPRVALGMALRGIASAAIDVSDGLVGDLGHVLDMSGVGATLQAEAVLPLVAQRSSALASGCTIDSAQWLAWALSGGDDYELLFSAPEVRRHNVAAAALAAGTTVTRIGKIDAAPGLRVLDASGKPLRDLPCAFDHFIPDVHGK
ncbi:MAG: thiamine-phosphate kinase [Pseudomonadota bacterium]